MNNQDSSNLAGQSTEEATQNNNNDDKERDELLLRRALEEYSSDDIDRDDHLDPRHTSNNHEQDHQQQQTTMEVLEQARAYDRDTPSISIHVNQDETSAISSLREDHERDDAEKVWLIHHWNQMIRNFWFAILCVMMMVLWPSGVIAFSSFQQHTDSTFHRPLPNSLSAIAQQAFAHAYPRGDYHDPMHPGLLVVLHGEEDTNNRSIPLQNDTYARTFALGLERFLMDYVANQTNLTWNNTRWVQATSYYSYQQQNLSLLAREFISPNGNTALIQIQYLLPNDDDKSNDNRNQNRSDAAATNHTTPTLQPKYVLSTLTHGLERYRAMYPPPPHLRVECTGLKYFAIDLTNATKQDLRHMDTLVLPVALILVGLVLPFANAWVVWMIPLCGIISTVCAWSIIMDFVAQSMQITQFTPSIMMSLTLGMGIDYSMFLLARYLEYIHKHHGCRRQDAIYDMLLHGGQVVLLSGITLMCTFLGLTCLPLQMLKSVGVGAAVAIACAILFNLLLVPALLYTNLGLWIVRQRTMNFGTGTSCIPMTTSEHNVVSMGEEQPHDSLLEPLLIDNRASPRLEEADEIRQQFTSEPPRMILLDPPKSIWGWLSKHLLHPYKSIIGLLLTFQILVCPVGRNAARIKSSSISFDLLLPANAPSLQAIQWLEELGGPGRLAPFRLLFDGSRSNFTIDSKTGFDIMHTVVEELLKQESHHEEEESPDIPSSMVTRTSTNETMSSDPQTTAKFTGISVLKNIPIPHTFFVVAKGCAENPFFTCPIESMRALNLLDVSVTSPNRYATFITVELSTSPFSDAGVDWLDRSRQTLQWLNESNALDGIDVYIEGSAAIAHDAVSAVYENFPLVVAITLAVVFLLMGLFFRSIVPPLRSIVSIACTISFSYGLAVLIYQDGLIGNHLTYVRSLSAVDGEICWLVPVMSFSIIVGLALDYDVFLVSRILEFRNVEAYCHHSSIVAGLDATGGIITAAGIIMAISFGSLLTSSTPALYQWSFLLTTAVLLDTFVIRTLVVPTLTGLAGSKYCWYPRELSVGYVRFQGFDAANEFNNNPNDNDEPGRN